MKMKNIFSVVQQNYPNAVPHPQAQAELGWELHWEQFAKWSIQETSL